MPRGAGIKTRRPLIIEMKTKDEEWAEFVHTGEKKFFDFNEVREEIGTYVKILVQNDTTRGQSPLCRQILLIILS